MIVFRNLETDERQIVAALDGIDLDLWEVTDEDVPNDPESRPYVVIDGALAPVPAPERRFSKPEFLDLWTPAETVAVMKSTDPMMAFFWARTLAWDGVFLLSDSRVIAGAARAVELEILTQTRADRILSGRPPE